MKGKGKGKACRARVEARADRRDFDAMFREPALERLSERRGRTPPCLAGMGCLCAGHARGNPASAPCDTSEGPPAPKMIELLDELAALAREVGRTASDVVRAQHVRATEGRKSRRAYDALRDARARYGAAGEAYNRARAQFLARFA